jgi:hypothetical protein
VPQQPPRSEDAKVEGRKEGSDENPATKPTPDSIFRRVAKRLLKVTPN